MWLRNALRNWRRRRDADTELDREVRGYVDMLAEQKMGDGIDARNAQREAKMEFGGIEQVKEQTREVRAGHFLETLWQDVRYGARMLRKNPGFTLVAVITLALGIGANTAIFSVIESVLLRPLPYDHPENLIEVWNTYLPVIPLGGLSPGDFQDWQKKVSTTSEMAAYAWVQQGANLTGSGDPQRVQMNYATSNLFPMLGVKPAVGRLFTPDEDRANSAPVVVLSHRFWQSRFGADQGVVGKTVTLDSVQYTIVGVLSKGSHLLDASDLWLPLGQLPDDLSEHVHHELVGIARLKPGTTIAQARAEFEALNRQSAIAYPAEHKNFGVEVRRMQDPSAAQMRESLLVLFGAVALVLLIACANIVNLLLARNANREKEIALRTALGANRGRLVRQLLTESVLLALLGGGLGIAFALPGVQALGSLAPKDLAAVQETHLDGNVFLFTIVVCVLVGIVCGLLPALQVRKTNVTISLKEGGRGSGALSSRKLHNLLVVSEIALALVPLVGAGLLLRSLNDLLTESPGFRAEHLLTVNIPQAAIPPAQLSKLTAGQQQDLLKKLSLQFEQIIEGVEGLPGVKSAAGIDVLPLALQIQQASRFVIEGRPIPDAGVRPIAQFRIVTPNYFSTVGLPLLSGRTLRQEDWNGLSIDINEAMARRFWPQGNAIGGRINLCSLNPKPCWITIVGIVGDVHQFGLDAAPTYDVYFSGGWTPNLIVRTASDPHRVAIAAADVIHKIDPALPVANVMTMDELLAGSVAPRRFSAILTTIFAVLALLLAAVGIYGVMSYMVGRRTSEIGIRMALGAQPRDVLRLIVKQGLKLAIIGVALGICGSLAMARLISSLLFGVRATDPVTFGAVVALLTSVAIAACYIPARRAMKVDPIVALRYE
ncbi:MAG TPA: ABC transporter permease [Candidatus Acidoferrales bacterium]|nr:ABC transporter permease [Candidatus Acidoferrales bacterium]